MIKKVFLYGIAVLGVAAVAVWNVSLNSQQSNKLSDTMLANVEALADGESNGYSCSASANCYYGNRVEGTVSCTGINVCTSGYQFVICDGHRNSCL